MTPLELLFWLCAALVAYAYLLYPLLQAARVARRPHGLTSVPKSISVVLAAFDEEQTIGRRLTEFTERIRAADLDGEVIVVSDGSTDATATVARAHSSGIVRVIELPANMGKAVALSTGSAAARGEILIFADARQRWAPDALPRLLENFADPSVGAASGELILETSPGVMAGVGLYWRYEKWVRRQESSVYSTVGVTGAISAVRRALFRPIPRGTLLDDVYWPLQVAMQGFRVVYDGRARAYDRLPDRPRDEFRRKVRTLSGNFQLLTRLPAALLPWRNPICFQFLSHKIARLLVPWALLAMLLSSAALRAPFYHVAFYIQACFYILGLAGISKLTATRLRFASAAGSFLILNAAAWIAFWVWISARADKSWKKVSYQLPPAPAH